MDGLEKAAAAIRQMESANDYSRQQDIRANGSRDRKVGAYGLLESRWDALSTSLGYTGARWQDRKAQDVIAKEKLRRDYEATGSWELAIVAFRYGRQVAMHFKEQDIHQPKDMENAGYTTIGRYLRDTRRGVSDPEQTVEGTIRDLEYPKGPNDGNVPEPQTQASPDRKRSEDIVRNKLVGMRDAQKRRGVTNGDDSEQQQDGDTGVSDIAE